MGWSTILEKINSSYEIYRLTSEECLILYDSAPLHQLMDAAHHRRKLHNPTNKVTYLVDRNINYTNICTYHCALFQINGRSRAHGEGGGGAGCNRSLPARWHPSVV